MQAFHCGCVLPVEVAGDEIRTVVVWGDDAIPPFRQQFFQRYQLACHFLCFFSIDVAVINKISDIYGLSALEAAWHVAVHRIELGGVDGVVGSTVAKSDFLLVAGRDDA